MTTVQLADVLSQSSPRISVEPDGVYPAAGVFGFGRGILLREPVKGNEISAAHLFRISSGQIIYSRLKAFEGAFALVPHHADGRFVTNEFPTFDVDESRAVPEFIALLLSVPRTWERLAQLITGVGARRERLQVADFLSFKISLPEIAEQRQIVATAQAIDVAITANEAAIASAYRLLRAAWHNEWKTLSDRVPVRTLGDVSTIVIGGTPSRARPEYFGGSIPWLKTGEIDYTVINTTSEAITEDALTASPTKLIPAGTVVMAMKGQGATRGRVGILGCDMATNEACAAFLPTVPIDARFLFHYLWSQYDVIRKHDEGTSQANLNKRLVGEIEVLLPSLSEQQRAAVVFEGILESVRIEEDALSALRELRAATLDVLISGERRPDSSQLLSAAKRA